MKKVYIAGAYSSNVSIKVLSNIGRAIDMYNKLLSLGFAPYCPHFDNQAAIMNWESVNNSMVTSTSLFNVSLEWLKVSDCVLVVGDYTFSRGVQAEIEEAKKLGIPVYFDLDVLVKKEK